jgi:hypothetical protein
MFAQFLAGILGAAQMGRGPVPVGDAGRTPPPARSTAASTG